MSYEAVIWKALEIANADPRKPGYLQGEIFIPPQSYDHLSIYYDPQTVNGPIELHNSTKSGREEVYTLLETIGIDALDQALFEARAMEGLSDHYLVNKIFSEYGYTPS